MFAFDLDHGAHRTALLDGDFPDGALEAARRHRAFAWRGAILSQQHELAVAQALAGPGLHWNEDSFDLPPGAVELLTRHGDGVTAFRAGDRAWGVQFHPEADAAALEGWYRRYGAWLAEAGVTEAEARAADAEHLPGQAQRAEWLFGAFGRVVAAGPPS